MLLRSEEKQCGRVFFFVYHICNGSIENVNNHRIHKIEFLEYWGTDRLLKTVLVDTETFEVDEINGLIEPFR